MKNLAAILFIFFSLACFSQDIEIKSEELNVIIWEKINQRLVSLGKKPITVYENGEMKQFGIRTCERLVPANAEFRHSNNDSISKYCGGECIYTYQEKSTSNNDFIDYLKTGNLDAIAQKVVDGWVGSDSHRRAISEDYYTSTTVATVIIYNEKTGYFKIAAAWHEKDSLWGNTK